MPVFKRSEDKKGYVVRLFNPTDAKRTTTLSLPLFKWEKEFALNGYQVRSFMFDTSTKQIIETDLIERPKK